MKRHVMTRILSALLVVSMLGSCAPLKELAGGDTTVQVHAADGGGDSAVEQVDGTIDDYIIPNGDVSLIGGSEEGKGENPQGEPPVSDTPQEQAEPAEEQQVYRDGLIHIFNYRQLVLIGTDAAVMSGDDGEETVGLGAVVTDENGSPVVYAKDAYYCLEGDIPLPSDSAWRLPEDFSGDFTAAEPADGEEAQDSGETQDDEDGQDSETAEDATPVNERLYDAASDTVYIQNVYQLKTLSADDRGDIPVLSEDWNAEKFGMGQLLYPGGESGGYLTYGSGHQYVISAAFTAELPAVTSPALRAPLRPQADRNADYVNGRDYFGQVSVNIDGTDYILIGNLKQLEAINYGDQKILNQREEIEAYGPIYKVTQTRPRLTVGWDDTEQITQTVELIYPGDADMLNSIPCEGNTYNFKDKSLYDTNHALLGDGITGDKYPAVGLTWDGGLTKTRTRYCTVTPEGEYDIDGNLDPKTGLKYEQSGNYIVFRNIDIDGAWSPLMFNGTMIGATSVGGGKLWQDGENLSDPKTWNHNVGRPNLYHFEVTPVVKSGKLDAVSNDGVGFFGTLTGQLERTNTLGKVTTVRNIQLSNGTVTNPCEEVNVDQTLVNILLDVVGTLVGWTLDTALTGLLGTNVNLKESLKELLNARASDPSTLATGAFAGRIVGNVVVEDCLVENVTVETAATTFEGNGKIVGKGGFVGHVQGSYRYDALTNGLDTTVDALSTLLNLIPGVGLGDLVDVLLNNALPTGKLIPTGYNTPQIRNCTVSGVTLSDEAGKYGVGGFAGSQCGAVISQCRVTDNASLAIKAERFGGGFAGVVRDDYVKALLNDLGVVVPNLYPQSEIIECAIENCHVNVTGDNCLGGFIGTLANSYAVNDDIAADTSVTVEADGDCIGGFVGQAQLGSSFGLMDYLKPYGSLLGTVKDLLTNSLNDNDANKTQQLLALGGVAQAAVLGVHMQGPIDLTTYGNKIGGIVGSGQGVYIGETSALGQMQKYKSGDVTLPDLIGRANYVSQLMKVRAFEQHGVADSGSYAGGVAGWLTSANAGSLLGSTLGLKSHLGFHVSDLALYGISDGYTVEADVDYAGGGVGFAIGGDVERVTLHRLKRVTACDHAGGFVGTTGPDRLTDDNGLGLKVLGLNLIKISNLLSLTDGVHTNFEDDTVIGVENGFTVEATGSRGHNDNESEFTAGGFAADTTSVTMTRCRVENLKSVTANEFHGMAGGFVGKSAAGSMAGFDAEDAKDDTALSVDQLLKLEADLIPTYKNCHVYFVQDDQGFVRANAAGGFVGDLRSGNINAKEDHSDDENYNEANEAYVQNPYAVHYIDYVHGGEYAGGFGGKVYSGALLDDGGSSLSLLGNSNLASIDLKGLSNITKSYIPTIRYAGVEAPQLSENGETRSGGLTVLAAYAENDHLPATQGYAGGFIGYGSGIQVSYCHVNQLKHGNVNVPTQLEAPDGKEYMDFNTNVTEIPYAVAGARYAGGYIGYMNVGSVSAMGDGIKLLGESLNLNSLVGVMDVVVSTIEHSHVYGAPGGYSVLASSHVNLGDKNYDENGVGYTGGFAGRMMGAHIQDSNAENFAYVIGEVAAGGYAGEMEPGNVADVLDYQEDSELTNLLKSVLDTDMISLVQAFVPTVYNSRTTCIPCGGAVRAQSLSSGNGDESVRRGFAGGYVGHGAGAQIWGDSSAAWKEQTVYSGDKRDCDAVRIRSVYGAEFAGGYVGLLEAGSTASTGNLSLLGGLVSANNLLGALNVVYPTIEYGNVYGPLEQTDYRTWNKWVEKVGRYGGFASELLAIGEVGSQEELNEHLGKFLYGYRVVAGRDTYDHTSSRKLNGCAGGYIGAMYSGVIRYGTANNVMSVKALHAAGGFAGEMQTKGVADVGEVNLFGKGENALKLKLGNLLSVADVLVPVVFESGVTGYRNGLIVRAEGLPTAVHEGSPVSTDGGMAGGFVGTCYGGQIGEKNIGRNRLNRVNNEDTTDKGAWVRNLKTVKGKNCVGGFVGKTTAASVANVDSSESSDGMVQNMLNQVVSNPSQLADVLDATVSVIGKAEVTAAKPEWGIVVDGEYTDNGETKYASCAGGFVGLSEATVYGNRSDESRTLTVSHLRGVSGGYYAGGFFGLADVGSVAQVGSDDGTKVLSLIQAGNVSLLDVFRTYIYHATVTGVDDGMMIYANNRLQTGAMSTSRESGAAGGFGGGLMNGTVEHSSVSGLNLAQAPNYAGGFIGVCGTSGGIGVDKATVTENVANEPSTGNESAEDEEDKFTPISSVLRLLGLGDLTANPQILNIVGSTVTDCSVSGFAPGFIVRTSHQQTAGGEVNGADVKGSCAAGFCGFADMAHIEDSHVTGFKFAKGPQIAAGFVGRSAMNYLVDVDVSASLLDAVLRIVNVLVKALYLDQAQQSNLIGFDSDLAGLKLMSDGDLLYVNLLGLKIGASLSKQDPEYENCDAVIVTIGSSTVKLPCDEDGLKKEEDGKYPNLSLTLIEGNRTDIKNSSVTGIEDGYDVFAGGADNDRNGTDSLGYAGGFMGYNDAGMITACHTELCDVVRGTENLVGPFVGHTDGRSRGVDFLEGSSQSQSGEETAEGNLEIQNNNTFYIYRLNDNGYTQIRKNDAEHTPFAAEVKSDVQLEEDVFNRYQVLHLNKIRTHADMENAVESDSATAENRLLDAYASPAMAVLMLNVPLDDNGAGETPMTSDLKDPCDEVFDLTVNKVWRDFVILDTRPDSITVRVAQVEAGTERLDQLIAAGTPGENRTVVRVYDVTLDDTNRSKWSSSWQTFVNDLPVAFRNGDSADPTYYQYYVQEVEVKGSKLDNYTASYQFDPDSATVKVINLYKGFLPDAGGPGTMLLYTAGILLIVCGGVWLMLRMKSGKKGKKQRKAAASASGETITLDDLSDFLKDRR